MVNSFSNGFSTGGLVRPTSCADISGCQMERLANRSFSSNAVLRWTNDFNWTKEGITILKGFPTLLISLFLFSATLLVLQISDTQFMVLARLVFEEPATVAGYVMAASGIGMFTASAVLTKIKLPSVLATTSIGGIGVGSTFAIVALLTPLDEQIIYIVFPILCFVGGASFGLASIPFLVNVQKEVSVLKTGRVFGTIGSVTTISSFIGMSIGGVLSQAIGVIQTFVVSDTVLIIMGTIMLLVNAESRGLNVTESDGGIQGKAQA
jgi:hypothetical protein